MPSSQTTRSIAVLAAPAALAMMLAGAPSATAQDKTVELKLSHWVPPTHPLQKAMQEWGASVEKASNGTLKYKVFPSQQLGKAFDHYDMARDGIADFVYVNPGYQPGRFPIIAAGELPFLVGDAKGGIKAIDTWYRKYAATEMKDVKYCFSFILDPLTWHSKNKKITVPARHQGHEGAAVAGHRRRLGDAARRNQRAGVRDRGARRARKRAWPKPSPSRGARCRCWASTASPNITWMRRSIR